MTVIFVLGIAAMGKTDAKDGAAALADVMAGIVIMAMVLLCPYAVFKFVHWAADTDGESLHRAGGAGAQIARAYGEKAARKGAAAAAGGGGAAAGSEAGAAAPGGEGAGAGGFPGDIAADPTGGNGQQAPSDQPAGSSPSGSTGKPSLDKVLQPAPTSVADDTSGQIGGTPGPSAPPIERRIRAGWRMAVRTTDDQPSAACSSPALRLSPRPGRRHGRTAAAGRAVIHPPSATRGAGGVGRLPPSGFHPRARQDLPR